MRFLHLSDLHLGKSVNGYSMIEDQGYMINEILHIIDVKQLDVVLIAGDVYDKLIATTEAIKLFDYFLEELVKRNIKVIVSSGNHDSAVRLGTGSNLMENSGVYISKEFDGTVKKISLEDEYGVINFYLLPFVKPIHIKQIYKLDDMLSYTDSIKFIIDKLDIDEEKRNVILSHQFVVGADLSGSEDIINVGGLDNVSATVYSKFDYVALGHIHRAQDIIKNKMRYPGTILKYSFSEVNEDKTVTIVDIKDKGNVNIETIPLKPIREMKIVEGYFKDIVKKSQIDKDYVKIVLLDEDEVYDAFATLSNIYPNIMAIEYNNQRTKINNVIGCANKVDEKKPIELVSEFFKKVNNTDLNEKQLDYLNNKIEKIFEE